jgi:hypothetical protein
MKNKFNYISVFGLIYLFSCSIGLKPAEKLVIKRNIDIYKPHDIKSKYYISPQNEYALKDSCLVKISVINRLGGRPTQNGLLFIEGSEKKYIEFDTSNFTLKLKKGYYYFNIKPPIGSAMDCSTDEVLLSENSTLEIHFLIGSLLQK